MNRLEELAELHEKSYRYAGAGKDAALLRAAARVIEAVRKVEYICDVMADCHCDTVGFTDLGTALNDYDNLERSEP